MTNNYRTRRDDAKFSPAAFRHVIKMTVTGGLAIERSIKKGISAPGSKSNGSVIEKTASLNPPSSSIWTAYAVSEPSFTRANPRPFDPPPAIFQRTPLDSSREPLPRRFATSAAAETCNSMARWLASTAACIASTARRFDSAAAMLALVDSFWESFAVLFARKVSSAMSPVAAIPRAVRTTMIQSVMRGLSSVITCGYWPDWKLDTSSFSASINSSMPRTLTVPAVCLCHPLATECLR